MGSLKPKWARWLTLGVLAIGGLAAAIAVACGGTEVVTERVVETVIVEKQLPGETITERVVETVVVETRSHPDRKSRRNGCRRTRSRRQDRDGR